MNRLKNIAVTVIVAAALITTGCSNQPQIEQVYIEPDCVAPPLPSPPEITGEELEPLADEVYWRVVERDNALQSAVLERQAMLVELCDSQPD